MNKEIKPLLNSDQETIVALCTPQGSGAIGVIRLSGDDAIKIADTIAKLSSGGTLQTQQTHTIHHGHIVAHKNTIEEDLIDEVLFLLMAGPRTFTGQDTVEITCHNNSFIINRILQQAVAHGARLAKAGEFTKRAYLHGKIDLVQAEAIRDLIHAPSEEALKASLAQSKGTLSRAIKEIEQEIIMLLTLTEASFEFLEEEQQDIALKQLVTEKIAHLLHTIQSVKSRFNEQKMVRDGIRIALVGSVNAGKSTLFNALANKERAIVSNLAGTTRDTIEYNMVEDGIFWSLIDTAGLRETSDIIEQQGIARSLEEASTADIVLLVVDGSSSMAAEDKERYASFYKKWQAKTLLIKNKVDISLPLPQNNFLSENISEGDCILLSAKTGLGIDRLKIAIKNLINTLFKQYSSPYLLNQRHMTILIELENKIKFIADSYLDSLEYELIAYELRSLIQHIAELTGKQASEEILSTVFSTFCIGK